MQQKIHKLITPFIIIPLVTGGLVSFIALSYQGSDVTRLISNSRAATIRTFVIGKGVVVLKIILAAFTGPVLSFMALLASALLLAAAFLGIQTAVKERVRNRSPTRLAFI